MKKCSTELIKIAKVAQMIKKQPTVWETRVWSLGWIPGHGNPLQYSCLENPHGQRSLAGKIKKIIIIIIIANAGEDVENQPCISCWWESKMVQPSWKIVCWFLIKLNIQSSHKLVIAILGIYSWEMKVKLSFTRKSIYVISHVYLWHKNWNQPRFPSTVWII